MDGIMNLKPSVEKQERNANFADHRYPRAIPVPRAFRQDLPDTRMFPDCQVGGNAIPDERNYRQT
jgi:hypothetical protein